jgi:hypothetical protein
MNIPKLSFKITRYDFVKNLLGDSYADFPGAEIVTVGTYTLAHVDGMQNNLLQEEDVSDYMEELLSQVTLIKDYNETT